MCNRLIVAGVAPRPLLWTENQRGFAMITSTPLSKNRVCRILIVDDHPTVRDGLTLQISAQADLEVCGYADSESEGLTQVERTAPDLAIVDISLGEGHGIDLIRKIRARHPTVKLLVLSQFDESLYAERSLRAGAHGYINKRQCQDDVIAAIRTVLSGQRYMSAGLMQRLVGQAVGTTKSIESDPMERLSDRELQVFRLIGQGLTTRAIANQLNVSIHTIDSHRENIRRKLWLKNGNELMRRAFQWVMETG